MNYFADRDTITENKVNIDADKPAEIPELIEIASKKELGIHHHYLVCLVLQAVVAVAVADCYRQLEVVHRKAFSGFGIDGYVSGATVFWDIDGDFIQDSNETVQTTTDSSGFTNYQAYPQVLVIVIKSDGVDTNTGGSVGMMAAYQRRGH